MTVRIRHLQTRAVDQLTDSALCVVWVTSSPRANADVAWSLREVVGVGAVQQRPHNHAVDEPIDLFRCPVNTIAVVSGLAGNVVDASTVVGLRVSFTEIVGLGLVGLGANPFPINLIQIVGLQDNGGHNTSSRSRNEIDLQLAEHDEEVAGDCGSISLLLDPEGGRLLAVYDGVECCCEVRCRLAACVGVIVLSGKSRVRSTGWRSWSAQVFFFLV